MAAIGRLPRRFPVGTRYVLEGVPTGSGRLRVISRMLLLPDGQQFDLTEEARKKDAARRAGRTGARWRRRTKH